MNLDAASFVSRTVDFGHNREFRLKPAHRYSTRNEGSAAPVRMVGESASLAWALRAIALVAPTDMTVLILGETGTGKELAARAVHAQSARSNRPLITVNCAALPGDLIESELFGHEKGAFTGAAARKIGRFELAHGGTIFLDEIADLPLSLQAKLLRVLQEKEFERLGSGKTIKVDTRILAATNRNLREAVAKGRFREDLYYRLSVYPISLPPLRERPGDVFLLASQFLNEAERQLGKSFGAIPSWICDALLDYQWPGNVRELQNVIQRAAVTSKPGQLELPEGWRTTLVSGFAVGAAAMERKNSAALRPSSEASLDEVGRNYIRRILQQTHWRIEGPTGAAAILAINPSTLRSRMRKLGIERPDDDGLKDSLAQRARS
jgi:transcriptional regulator with GAF, ATPase, and Fis domain